MISVRRGKGDGVVESLDTINGARGGDSKGIHILFFPPAPPQMPWRWKLQGMSEARETIELYVRMSSRLLKSKHSTSLQANSHCVIMGS